jgi:hypothetical protein
VDPEHLVPATPRHSVLNGTLLQGADFP